MDVILKVTVNKNAEYKEVFPSLVPALEAFKRVEDFFDSYYHDSGFSVDIVLLLNSQTFFENSILN